MIQYHSPDGAQYNSILVQKPTDYKNIQLHYIKLLKELPHLQQLKPQDRNYTSY